MFLTLLVVGATISTVVANPYQGILSGIFYTRKPDNGRFYDIQAHRGGRANTIENTLPSFAWGLIEGSTTLEMDNGLTKDGIVIVWHDQAIHSSKCRDTGPVYPNDPLFPYVGKFIANLTLAQIKTLDCGSQRQPNFPSQLTYPGTRISTLQELFDFLECADPHHHVLMNIESKIDPLYPNQTLSVEDFVEKQHEIFYNSHYYRSITYQSFDWRSLIEMKRLDPVILTSALVDDETTLVPEGYTVSPWLGGLDLSSFDGSGLGGRIAQAARAIGADILSPTASAGVCLVDEETAGCRSFITPRMVNAAHDLGMLVKPWTVNKLDIADRLLDLGVDGIITDAPDTLRRWAQQKNLLVAPRYAKYKVLACLSKHNEISLKS